MIRVLVVEELGARQLAYCLRQGEGIEVHAVAFGEAAELRHSRFRRTFSQEAEPACEGARLEAIRAAVRRTGADLLLPVRVAGIRFASAHQAALRSFVALPALPAVATLDLANDKWALAQHLRAHGLPHPPTVRCTPDQAGEDAVRSLAFPALLKPLDWSAGAGISLHRTPEELLAARRQLPPGTRALAQGYLPGQDLSCSLLARDGVILASTLHTPLGKAFRPFAPSFFIEFLEDPEAMAVARDLVASLGWSGVMNIDLRRDERTGRVSIIECNPRYWANVVGSQLMGVNIPRLQVLEGLGLPRPRAACRRGRYLSPTSVPRVLRQCLEPATSRRGPMPHLADADLRYAVSDPVPMLEELGRSVQRWLARPAHH